MQVDTAPSEATAAPEPVVEVVTATEEVIVEEQPAPKVCYCNGEKTPDKPMLCCTMCNGWFHPQCLQKPLDLSLFYDRGLLFHCAKCAGRETVERVPLPWHEIVMIALYNLGQQYAPRREFDFAYVMRYIVALIW